MLVEMWDNKSDEDVLDEYESALKEIAIGNMASPTAFDIYRSRYCQRRLDRYILPQVERRGLVEFHN